jgi:putative MATE family efflux protein
MHQRIDEFIKDPKKALFKISWPIMAGMFVQALYNIIGTAWVGRLGAEAIAALTFSFPLFFVLISLNSGIGMGMGSAISRYLGAKKKEEAQNTALHGLLISIVFAVATTVVGILTLRPLFILFGAAPDVVPLATDYMGIILFGTIFMFPSFVMNYIFTSEGDTKTPVKVQVMGLVLNMILDPIFIYVLKLGVKGAGIAAVISFFVTFLIMLYYFRKRSFVRLSWSSFKFRWKTVKEITDVGAPAAATMLLLSVYVIFINRFMAHYGTDYVAAFGIASRWESMATMPIMAFSIALMTLVAMFYGAKRYDLLKSIVWYGIRISAAITSAFGILFFIFPTIFMRIFTPDPVLISLSAQYLRLDVFTFPIVAITVVISRVMQGLGRGMPGLILNLLRVVFVAVPLAALFVYVFHLSFIWIAVAMICGGIVSSIAALIWLNSTFKKLHIQG